MMRQPKPKKSDTTADPVPFARHRRFRCALLVATLTFILAGLAPPLAQAEEPCEVRLGFATLREAIIRQEGRDVVGACLANERYDLRGNATQRTSAGTFTWRKSENRTQFKAGPTTWTMTSTGIEKHAKARGKSNARGLGKGHNKAPGKGEHGAPGKAHGKSKEKESK